MCAVVHSLGLFCCVADWLGVTVHSAYDTIEVTALC